MHAHELMAAGVRDRHLAEAYRHCGELLARKNSAAYPIARILLPPGKRPYYDAMLAFCGYADNLLDDPEKSIAEREEAYDRFVAYFFRTEDESSSGRPVAESSGRRQEVLTSRAFRHFTRTWGVTDESVRDFLLTIRGDLSVTSFPTYGDLHRYMQGVSGVPGRWVNMLLEPRHEGAAGMATALGYGIYLLDFLADLREDFDLGRVYLPLEDLRRFGLDRASLGQAVRQGTMTEPLRELVRFEAERVSRYFDEADEWWHHVHPSSRELPRQYLALGRQTLRQLIRGDCDVFRARPPGWILGATRAFGTTGLSYLRARRDRRRYGVRPLPAT
ncbi:squalene/phytoene synthase family protein [Streptomyces sp. 891-h]|uniref:phytoene/squalene synthase family protein n=1 Tax=Streptomyces sp. 891-h TaxID=2720714 RepID=UPI001FA95BEC|nr:squalene/phytoene synthase family protein [Streptomyces sp. 891-h]UNZ21275.1 squalene/phytoene synthase family protein [Streptomyces sp. 891-h]